MISKVLRILAAATLLMPLLASADSIEGRVVKVSDGDTVTVLDANKAQWKIRLVGIDAPEKKMPFGQRSKQNLSDMVFNKQVTIEYSKRDQYGRTLGKIIVDGLDANLEQVKSGMAWHYKKYQKEQAEADRTAYAEAEELAKSAKLGLWSDNAPVPPWDWRRTQKAKH